MNLMEAERLLAIDYNKNKIDRVSESVNYFIFSIVPIITSNKLDRPVAASIAVDKRTGQKVAFNPMRFPKSELESIRRII